MNRNVLWQLIVTLILFAVAAGPTITGCATPTLMPSIGDAAAR